MNATNTTIENLIDALKSALREIPDDFMQVGCRSNDATIREITYRRRIAWARGFANDIEKMSTEGAAAAIAEKYTELTNVDPSGFYIGGLPHQIRMHKD